MNNDKYLYKKSQYSFFVIFIILTIVLIVIISKKTELILLNIILLLFYKLTIIIDREKITAKFAFGIIKKSIKFDDINFDSIEKIKINWLTGIGLRITTDGILYNVKPGFAIKINYINKTSSFLIGTDDFESIKKVLILQKNRK